MHNMDQLHAHDCYQTSGHRISQKKYTLKNCESGLAIKYKACCTLAVSAHTTDHVEIAWTDEAIFFAMHYQ